LTVHQRRRAHAPTMTAVCLSRPRKSQASECRKATTLSDYVLSGENFTLNSGLVVMNYAPSNCKRRAGWSRVKAIAVAVSGAWQTLTAALGPRARSDHESFLDESFDHAEVERRERAYDRWQSRGGSLLGW